MFCIQDLLPELQSVCQCHDAVVPPAAPEVLHAEVSGPPQPEDPSEAKLKCGLKRKRRSKDPGEPPVKKILGDGTRLPGTPVTWKSGSTGIVIKLVKCLQVYLKIKLIFPAYNEIYFLYIFSSDLTMEIVRYRLIGPQSHSVLTDTLEAATVCHVSAVLFAAGAASEINSNTE